MSAFAPPFQPGDYSTNAAHAADLGKSYRVGARTFVLCKATAAISTPANKVVATALGGAANAKAPTWSVATTTTAFDPNSVGLIPAEYGTVTIPISAYFLVQTGGPALAICAAAVAAGVAIGSSTTAGDVDDASAVAGNEIGVSLEAGTNAADLIGVLLKPRF
jgi:hypothetical protein